ncbi:LPS export ABC transporter periplasmic protein LptC [Bacterioplanoides sp.]|uniref:LPS export ABC transporter periplasmic protein LptC n=1 Tax=Bacterioplanoides sp. TaxID=2066072 RepID=UPI003B5BCFE5
MRKRYLLLVMTLLFGVALLAVDNYTQESTATLSERQTSEPDYYGQVLFNRRYDDQGRMEQSFSAERSTHYPISDNTVFQGPVIHVQDEDGMVWQVVAEEGSMNDQDDLLSLRRDVEVRPLDSDNSNGVVIQTQSLDYFTKRQLAQTEQPVIITDPHTRVDAVGMVMDMKKQRMELKAKVETQYVPQ